MNAILLQRRSLLSPAGHAESDWLLRRFCISWAPQLAIGDIDRSAVKDAGSRLGLRVGRRLDVTDRRSFTDFLDNVEDQLGPVDVLVNNAGVIAVGSAVAEADAITQRVLDVNIYGVILGTKLAAQRMLPRGQGHIVNIASAGRCAGGRGHRNLLRHKACRGRLHR